MCEYSQNVRVGFALNYGVAFLGREKIQSRQGLAQSPRTLAIFDEEPAKLRWRHSCENAHPLRKFASLARACVPSATLDAILSNGD